jgi:riboflavin kinase/FMN adenylyltransferase
MRAGDLRDRVTLQVPRSEESTQSGQGADEVFAGYFWYPRMAAETSGSPLERFRKHYFDRDHDEFLEMSMPAYHGPDYTAETIGAHLAEPFADEFIDQILVKKLEATHVIVGENFTFGRGAQGTAQYLQSVAKGFETSIVQLSENRGNPISSTRIRGLIFDGEVARAKELLTRSHYLVGPVVHGEKRGRTIGYPTANIGLDDLACIPADGVYAGWLTVENIRWAAAISIGTNPTFPGVRGRQVEAYALDQVGLELYDKIAKVEFTERLRDTLKFDSLDSLLVQMKADCDRAAELT